MLLRAIIAVERADIRQKLKQALKGQDVLVDVVRGGRDLWQRLGRESGDLILVSRSLIPEPARETLKLLVELPESPSVVVVTPDVDPEERARFVGEGCAEVVYSGVSPESLAEMLGAVLDRRAQLVDQAIAAGRGLGEPRLADFVSVSPAMTAFLNVVQRVVSRDVSLLILGETGVGKERLARAIHAEGPRSAGPFIAVNCGALPEALLESELFGHEEGAFTGATRARRGCFELAHRGTIFLDEIGEIPLHLQVKLLRVLQEKEIQRVGGERVIPVDTRIMAATNRDLEAAVEAKEFRRDLFFRLGVVSLTLPPLRARREDIPPLVDSYINYLRPRTGGEVTGIEAPALRALENYPWPGNVRELVNVLERAMLLCEGRSLTLADLPETVAAAGGQAGRGAGGGPTGPDADPDWFRRPWAAVRREYLARLEREYLACLLRETRGRVGETAARAGMEARSLYDKMRRHGLRKEEFRRRPGRKPLP